jgi:methionine sulfoxide reductase heme-binding subunit
MIDTLAFSAGPSAYWYLTRSTGTVALILLTLSVALGVLDVKRITSKRVPRFVIDGAHRTASLLAVVFLVIHIATAVLDTFVSITLVDAVVPFVGSYRPFWLGLGAMAFDLLIALVLTSIGRRFVGYRTWRATHWLAYACWPVALLHGLGTGSDVKSTWMLATNLLCLAVVFVAVCGRAIAGWPDRAGLRVAALSGAVVFTVGLIRWLPAGPLGRGWAERSGTPPPALGSATTAAVATAAVLVMPSDRTGAITAPPDGAIQVEPRAWKA